jgi:hypothetical protein
MSPKGAASIETMQTGFVVPVMIAAAGDQTARRFLEFFAATHPQQERPHGRLLLGLCPVL